MTDENPKCAGPGRPPAKRCELDAVAHGLCGSHRRQEKANKPLSPLVPRRIPKPGGRITRYGLSFTSMAKLRKLESLAKLAGQSVHEYTSDRINTEWLTEKKS